MVSMTVYKNTTGKVKEHCCGSRTEVRKEHLDRVEWLKKKYKGEAKSTLPDDLKQFQDFKVFQEPCPLTPQEVSGAVIVLMERENSQLTPGERKLLAKGPKYCILKSCSDEAICKHKWGCLACGESDALLLEVPESIEEQQKTKRLQELAEELAAETRTIYDENTKTFNMNKRKVTSVRRRRESWRW